MMDHDVKCPKCGKSEYDIYDDEQKGTKFTRKCYCLECHSGFVAIYDMRLIKVEKYKY